MVTQNILPAKDRSKVVKAALLHPKNLMVLGIGIGTGILYHWLLLPIGVMAYGLLCYLDISSDDFVNTILNRKGNKETATSQPAPLPPKQEPPRKLTVAELLQLHATIVSAKDRIHRLYQEADDFTQRIFGDFFQIENLAERSQVFLQKAQAIRDYLDSEDLHKITQDIETLHGKVSNVQDEFARHQYQQALNARQKHLQSLQDMQHMYERLVSQLTNISISLDSLYPRMMKLKTAEDSVSQAESGQAAAELTQLLNDVEQLDNALRDHLELPA